MNLIARCPQCHVELRIEAVLCARCKRTVQPGEYLIAPPGSKLAGQPVCFCCLDGVARPGRPPKGAGPSETKDAGE